MARVSTSSKAMLLLLVLLYCSSLSHLTVLAETQTVEWEVGGGDKEYVRFTKQSLYKLVLKTCVGKVEGVPKLQKQEKKPGYNMLHVNIKSGSHRATLAIKPENLYLVGFQSQAGDWFAFLKDGDKLPGSKELSFNSSYRGLTGSGNVEVMAQVPVGKAAAAQATSVLASFKAGGTAMAEQEVRNALAMFVLVLSEAERFPMVRDQVVAAWNDGLPEMEGDLLRLDQSPSEEKVGQDRGGPAYQEFGRAAHCRRGVGQEKPGVPPAAHQLHG